VRRSGAVRGSASAAECGGRGGGELRDQVRGRFDEVECVLQLAQEVEGLGPGEKVELIALVVLGEAHAQVKVFAVALGKREGARDARAPVHLVLALEEDARPVRRNVVVEGDLRTDVVQRARARDQRASGREGERESAVAGARELSRQWS